MRLLIEFSPKIQSFSQFKTKSIRHLLKHKKLIHKNESQSSDSGSESDSNNESEDNKWFKCRENNCKFKSKLKSGLEIHIQKVYRNSDLNSEKKVFVCD